MFSATSEYALRALTEMASVPHGTSVLGRKLAKEAGIPSNYLAKILLELRNAGLVATARGSGGGYWLLRPADAIHLIDVVEVFEPGVKRGCLLGNGACSNPKNGPCSAHRRWDRVRKTYAKFLEETTLAEISRKH